MDGFAALCESICTVGLMNVVVLPLPVVPIIMVCAFFAKCISYLPFRSTARIGMPTRLVFGSSA